LENKDKKYGNRNFIINYFVPFHGKSEVDGIFGFFTTLLHDNLFEKGIDNINELISFLD
jgi:hypothetical protein